MATAPADDHDICPHNSSGPAAAAADEPASVRANMAHDSMVTVRLSGSASSVDAAAPESTQPETDCDHVDVTENLRHSRPDSSVTLSPTTSAHDDMALPGNDSDSFEDAEEVNWAELEKTEDEQVKDDETDNSTALLLARLEQENAKLATNPKSVKVQAVDKAISANPRSPSMAQLRQMMKGPTPPALRYSMLPPPPMTDLEFYAALVKDYQQTAARLPTLLSNKIRKGIPPPLRGVVWQSMSGARDALLEEQYDTFSNEASPYELLIGKDLGRSFPGVDMFRDSDGDGQRMLGRVLKSFSLYDAKIGYCQGLAFLVGPLLMHMPDKQAFCVLVRLMERYDLRACFLPDLSGLHVRIFQFRELLRLNFPVLSTHLEDLQVETAYVSQWFLSFFAVTCPLPMLFRIYDVIFAEGASETLMRVALSLMRKNEARLLACTELEDVMQLLLSRGLWDCYHYDADDFVQDFVSLTGVVTREKLAQLEQGYRESQVATLSATRASDITTAATRFLGRIWASSTGNKTSTLQPGQGAPPRPLSMLRRSTSKQSLASTLYSMEASSVSIASSASSSTDATTLSRHSANTDDGGSTRESTPVGLKSMGTAAKPTDDRYLHSQIEDLLTALSELQRNNSLVTNQLQWEREERAEDRKAVRLLLGELRKRAATMLPDTMTAECDADERESSPVEDEVDEEAASVEDDADETASPAEGQALEEAAASAEGEADGDTASVEGEAGEEATASVKGEADDVTAPVESDADEETPLAEDKGPELTVDAQEPAWTKEISDLVERVERRFRSDKEQQHSSILLSKSQLRDELRSAQDQLASAACQSQDLSRRIHDMDQETASLKEQLRERHNQVRTLHQEKQRLEKQVQAMRCRGSAGSPTDGASRDSEMDFVTRAIPAGLRELKLGRSQSITSPVSAFCKRGSSLSRFPDTAPQSRSLGGTPAASEHEALLLELVQAKTAEAMAKQEAEEAKQKLEAMRKSSSPAESGTSAAPTPSNTTLGMLSRLTGHGNTEQGGKAAVATTPSASTAGGGFWSRLL
ncbi:Rab-GAP/TBC domain protein [Ophiocordyceps camponoti-floridani]|uniref:Rab-GAP/TBC domain protein n=1 Tax=Ophiocordyceps camponoti-floridani TaxID=2030778 RepID=A0A8H4VDG9_9HYPO|nr:Rab-GAP/TBC domain protein [Ophiocordyceps camponoti-floridani]